MGDGRVSCARTPWLSCCVVSCVTVLTLQTRAPFGSSYATLAERLRSVSKKSIGNSYPRSAVRMLFATLTKQSFRRYSSTVPLRCTIETFAPPARSLHSRALTAFTKLLWRSARTHAQVPYTHAHAGRCSAQKDRGQADRAYPGWDAPSQQHDAAGGGERRGRRKWSRWQTAEQRAALFRLLASSPSTARARSTANGVRCGIEGGSRCYRWQ